MFKKVELDKATICFIIAIIIILICFFVYAYYYDSIMESKDDKKLVDRMKASVINGAIRGSLSGFILGGADYAILSGMTMAIINPLLTGMETMT
jgi:hypothetical protein